MYRGDALILAGIPEGIAGIIGLASVLVLVLLLAAFGGFVYKSLTGGIEWPSETESDDDEVRPSHDEDDEWEYY